MKLLALDTATEACSAALWLDGQVQARFAVAGRTHTQLLLPMVHGLMAEAGVAFSQLDGLVCGIGPGSFAGVRIGVGFVKGLALGLDRPVLGVSSLAMLAQGVAGAEPVLALIDARMGEVYAGLYVREASSLRKLVGLETVSKPDAIAAPDCAYHAIGTGWGAYPLAHLPAPLSRDDAALPRAEQALALAAPDFAASSHSAEQLLPNYLRDKVALNLTEQQALRR